MRHPTEIVIENGEDGPRRLPIALESDRARTRRGFMPKLLRLAGKLPFADDLAAAYFAAIDPATPRKAKAVLFAALAYFVFPLDTIPDMLALVGFSDDIAILTVAISSIRTHITEAHRDAARAAIKRMGEGKSPLQAR